MYTNMYIGEGSKKINPPPASPPSSEILRGYIFGNVFGARLECANRMVVFGSGANAERVFTEV